MMKGLKKKANLSQERVFLKSRYRLLICRQPPRLIRQSVSQQTRSRPAHNPRQSDGQDREVRTGTVPATQSEDVCARATGPAV